MDLRLDDFKLYLNANDSNVINDPASLEENTFLTVWCQKLYANLQIPLLSFRPSRNEITFDVDAQNGGFRLSTPPWNTQHVFLQSAQVAAMKDLKINGSYGYSTSTSPALTDVLRMNIHGIAPRIWLYGFLVRSFMRIKDNYFGDDIHFRTLEEYQEQITLGDVSASNGGTTIRRTRVSNDLDVILSITAVTADVLMPSHLYSSANNVNLGIPSLGLELRFTNYYMDLELNFSPITVSYASTSTFQEQGTAEKSETQVFVDGLGVKGHRLFGLPPTEPTYVCNWDFEVGGITGECSMCFVKILSSALQCFSFTLNDAENAMPPLFPVQIHDVTFLRARLELLRVWLRIHDAAILLSAQSFGLEYNDWAGWFFSERFRLTVPSIVVAVVDINDMVADRRNQGIQLKTYAYFESAIELFMHRRKDSFSVDHRMQQHHITLHDSRTSRTPWLIKQDEGVQFLASSHQPKVTAPAMPFPPMPEPLRTENNSILSVESDSNDLCAKAQSERSSKRNGSFLVKDRQAASTDVNNVYPRLAPENVSAASTSVRGIHVDVKLTQGGQSGPYKKPHFGLDGASPNLSELPARSGINSTRASSKQDSQRGFSDQENEELQFRQETCERTSILVDLGEGSRGLCKPQSLRVLALFFEELQVQEPVTLLDNLHMDAFERLPERHRRLGSHESITEVRMKVPCFNLRLLHQSGNDSPHTAEDVCCDLSVDECTITARDRKKTPPEAGAQASNSLFAHITLDDAEITMKVVDRQTTQEHAIMRFRFRDMSSWGCRGAESTAHAQFRDVESELDIRQMDALALVIPCGENLAKQLRQFKILVERQTARLRLLVLSTAVEGRDIPDPPFLTRASYVVRGASSHVRASQSWKIVSRLRYVYHVLPAPSQARLRSQCASASPSCPRSAREDVVAIFGRLGMWDGNDVRRSALLNEVFGENDGEDTRNPTNLSLKTSIKARDVRLTLQPGQTPSQLHFENIAFESVLRQRHLFLQGAPTIERLASSQLYCSNTALALNLNLLRPLQDFLGLLQRESVEDPSPQNDKSDKSSSSPYRMHFVLVSEMNTLALEAPNVKILYLCHPLSSSVVLARTAEENRPGTTFLTYADVATMEISSHSHIVSVSKVDRPSIFGNLDGQKPDSTTSSWHLAASCTDISLKVLEDPLSLLELAGRVLLDEAASIIRIFSSGQSMSKTSRPGNSASTGNTLGKSHVALFLDSYLIAYKILPALSYRVTGKIGRLSIRPGSKRLADSIVDFDLKKHAHAFLGRVGNDLETISELVIPPVNCRIVYSTATSQNDISFQSTIEHISLDAAAVHALLATLGRPEISELAASIQYESSRLLRCYKSTVASRKSVPASTKARQSPLFDAYITLVGLGIHTKSPKDTDQQDVSQLQFELGHVHLKGKNRAPSDKIPHKFPELFVSLRGLQVRLARSIAGQTHPCGDFTFGASFQATSNPNERQELVRAYQIRSTQCEASIYTETASVIIDILRDFRESFSDINMTNEVKGLQKLRRVTLADLETDLPSKQAKVNEAQSTALFGAMYSLQMTGLRIIWKVGDSLPLSPGREAEDLVLSFAKIDLATRRDNAARLLIQDFHLQMVPPLQKPTDRTLNSALLSEVVFNVAYMSNSTERRLAFHAAGKSLDLRLTSSFVIPASNLRRSIALAMDKVRGATKTEGVMTAKAGSQTQSWLKHKQLTSLLVDADFAGAVVYIQGRGVSDPQSFALDVSQGRRVPQQGRYGQFTSDNAGSNTTLRAPGLALKVEYKAAGEKNTSLNAEVKVDASSNVLYPSVVPLVLEISSSVKEIVGEPNPQAQGKPTQHRLSTTRLMSDERFRTADPTAIFQDCTLNLGLRICKQDFSLSCQPIARVDTTAQIDSIYVTVNTVQSSDHGQSFSLSSSFSGVRASVQHVYSRESSGGLEVQAAIISLMNSKHLGAPNGISAISQISPVKIYVNAKQFQDFLLFREIWLPADIRKSAPPSAPSPTSEPQAYIVQRYQQIAAAGAFPWNVTLSISRLDFQIDLGQSLGKSGLTVSDLWISSTKSSDWEQNLCLGLKGIKLDGTGRMSGFVNVQEVKVRTTIRWPIAETNNTQAPLIQASAGFDFVRIKAAFEYQAFLVADMTGFKFLMYNVRSHRTGHSDRLVGVVDLNSLRGFCTATSASQGLALYQAFERLTQEKQTAYHASLKELEKFLRRRSTVNPVPLRVASRQAETDHKHSTENPLRLQTKVMVSIGAVNVGVFPSTFFDTQLFRLQALDAAAQFAVSLEKSKLRSTLELALGQLQVALSGVAKPEARKSLGEVSLDDVVASATNSRGGTILKVPKVNATMQTWQSPGATEIEYIFTSAFQGKVDVGWNYSRIGFLRGMWNKHVRALASRLGKPLPQSALQITAALEGDGEGESGGPTAGREKITAVVNVPQSKYQYTPLEQPVIETPQLRDMGEATPPLEWIGLHRERLPNLTHQIVIVSLLELAREVDDAYSKILGSS